MEISPKLAALAPDLRMSYPRSPRELFAGYLLAGRALDKCLAELLGWHGEYCFNVPSGATTSLDDVFFKFTEIAPEDFRAQVATGATDEEMAEWIAAQAKPRPRIEIIQWNNWLRDFRLSDAPPEVQEYMEDYMPRHLPKGRVVHHFLDIYDIEEGRL